MFYKVIQIGSFALKNDIFTHRDLKIEKESTKELAISFSAKWTRWAAQFSNDFEICMNLNENPLHCLFSAGNV